MWRRLYLMTLVVSTLSKWPPETPNKLMEALGATLDYILQHYDRINVDCLFGVVLSGAILDDTHSGVFQDEIQAMKNRASEIYTKTLPLMIAQRNWRFTQHIVNPELWRMELRYAPLGLRGVAPKRMKADGLFSDATYGNFSEEFSDFCLEALVNETLDLKSKNCTLNAECEEYVSNFNGAGYMLTHKLLLIQIARVRGCQLDPPLLESYTRKICSAIYTEAISVEHFAGLDAIFDLFLEESLLCGMEGFEDFLQVKWLDYILEVQSVDGCFPVTAAKTRKRETNQWADGCADHPTGLAAALLSLYLNNILKSQYQ